MAGRFAWTLGVLILAAAAAPAAQAMDEGWSLEISLGQATFSDVTTSNLARVPVEFFAQLNLEYTGQQAALKRQDRSYTVLTGYRFNRYLAMETGFFRLGAFQYAATGILGHLTPVPVGFDFSFRAKGVMLGVTGTYPLGEVFEVRGRAGLASTDTRVRYTASVQSSVFKDQYSASSQDFYMGVGVGATLAKYYRVGLDWMLFDNMGHPNLSYRADAHNLMLSVAYLY
jgi:OOP family OmpA-OmpF porin